MMSTLSDETKAQTKKVGKGLADLAKTVGKLGVSAVGDAQRFVKDKKAEKQQKEAEHHREIIDEHNEEQLKNISTSNTTPTQPQP